MRHNLLRRILERAIGIGVLILVCAMMILSRTNALADMVKCVNDAGSIAFSNIQCPEGYRIYGVEAETIRQVPFRGTDHPVERRQPTDYRPLPQERQQYPGSATGSADATAAEAEARKQIEDEKRARAAVISMEMARLRSKVDSCPPLTDWKNRMNCQDRINTQMKLLESNPDQYFFSQQQEQSTRQETKEKPRGAINPRTGEYYPATGSGVFDPKTGAFFPKSGSGYINPQTGEYFPGQ